MAPDLSKVSFRPLDLWFRKERGFESLHYHDVFLGLLSTLLYPFNSPYPVMLANPPINEISSSVSVRSRITHTVACEVHAVENC